MQYDSEDIKNLYLQSMPKGRAFDWSNSVYGKALFQSFANVDSDYLQTTQDILDGMFPSNSNFDVEDARKLEKRYGILINEELTLSERKQSIEDRLSYPNGIYARQSASYMQYRLRRAGFDVYVHENRFESPTTNRARSGIARSGDARSGDVYKYYTVENNNISYTEEINNYIDVIADNMSDVSRSGVARSGVSRSSNSITSYTDEELRFTFFIGGETFPDFADVSQQRKDEFRHLILKLKPCQTKGFLIINYI